MPLLLVVIVVKATTTLLVHNESWSMTIKKTRWLIQLFFINNNKYSVSNKNSFHLIVTYLPTDL